MNPLCLCGLRVGDGSCLHGKVGDDDEEDMMVQTVTSPGRLRCLHICGYGMYYGRRFNSYAFIQRYFIVYNMSMTTRKSTPMRACNENSDVFATVDQS